MAEAASHENPGCSIDTSEIKKIIPQLLRVLCSRILPLSIPSLNQLQAVSSDFGPSDPVTTHLRPDSNLDNVSHAIEQASHPRQLCTHGSMGWPKNMTALLYSTTCKTKTKWTLKWKVVWLMLLLGKVSASVILGKWNMLTANFNKFMNRNRLWLNRLAINGEHLWRLVEKMSSNVSKQDVKCQNRRQYNTVLHCSHQHNVLHLKYFTIDFTPKKNTLDLCRFRSPSTRLLRPQTWCPPWSFQVSMTNPRPEHDLNMGEK